MKKMIARMQINEHQGSQGHEREEWVIGGCGRGLSECQGNAFNLIISNDIAIDRFSTFDPHQYVKVKMIIATKTDDIDWLLGENVWLRFSFFKSTSLWERCRKFLMILT